jgi:hypothetical protein
MGMSAKKLCRGCGHEKSVEFFSFRSKAKGTRASRCKTCVSAYVAKNRKRLSPDKRSVVNKAYYERRGRQKCKELPPHKKEANRKRTRLRNRALRDKKRRRLFAEYSKRCCVDCGETDPLKLQFDHVRGKKIAAVSDLVRRLASWDKIESEIAKCEVRCASCHQRKTALSFGWYGELMQEVVTRQSQFISVTDDVAVRVLVDRSVPPDVLARSLRRIAARILKARER